MFLNFVSFLNIPMITVFCRSGFSQYLADDIPYSRSLPSISTFVIRKSESSQDNPENIVDADHTDNENVDTEREVFIVKSEENLVDTSIY